MAERELRPTALINRTGCGLLSQSHKFPALYCRVRLSGGQTSLPRGVMQTQKNTSATQGHSLPPANIYCRVTAKACRIFLESSKLILVSAGLTLAFSLTQTKRTTALSLISSSSVTACWKRQRPSVRRGTDWPLCTSTSDTDERLS